MALLEVKNLTTDFHTDQGKVRAVRDVSFHVERGEVLGIVGESGSGKSVTMYTIMGLLADNGEIISGSVIFDAKEICRKAYPDRKAYEREMCAIRGNTMSMIFQDPMTFLNPVLKIGTQLIEPLMNHDRKMTKRQARKLALDLMRQVGIPSPEKRINQYPFEFSGGMRQRIVIAIALARNPKLIIADEPTTALDVTIQAQVLELIDTIRKQENAAVIIITHDLGIVAKMCDRINIMYGGKIVETGTDEEIFYNPKHPYTIGLFNCISNAEADDDKPLTPIPGSPPDLLDPPKGCPFVDRCDKAMRVCKDYMPDATVFSGTHQCQCWLHHEKAVRK
jgi:oligopeptide transport system ATP-binding protein